MEGIRLSSKGQVIIPKALRVAHHWEAGQGLVAIDVGDGISAKIQEAFSRNGAIAGCRMLELSRQSEEFGSDGRCDSSGSRGAVG